MRNDLHANLTVRIFTDRKCFGPGVAELLSSHAAAPCASRENTAPSSR